MNREAPRWWALALAAVLAPIALLRPALLAAPNRWWQRLGLALGNIVGPIALGILFYAPLGFVMRLTGKDPLRTRPDPSADVPGVHVIPNGVDISRAKPQDPLTARKALGWRLDGAVLLFPANARDPRKNFPLAKAVERRLREWGIDVRLEQMFERPHETIVQALNAADVLLLPSLHSVPCSCAPSRPWP